MKQVNLQMPLFLFAIMITVFIPNFTSAQQQCNPVGNIWIESDFSTPNSRTFVWDKVPGAINYTATVTVNDGAPFPGNYTSTPTQVLYQVNFMPSLVNGDLIEISVVANCQGNNSSGPSNMSALVITSIAVELIIPEGIHCFNQLHETNGYCDTELFDHYYLKAEGITLPGEFEEKKYIEKRDYHEYLSNILGNEPTISDEALFVALMDPTYPGVSPTYIIAECADQKDAESDCGIEIPFGDGESGRITNTTPSLIYPNPTTSVTNLNFSIEEESNVSISVINIEGKEVISVTQGETMPAGVYTKNIDAQDLAVGLYKIKINIDGKTELLSLMVSE